MMEKKVCALAVLAALSAAAFEVPPVKQWPKEKIPPAHAGRILHWEGIDNVRDLGGVKTRDGTITLCATKIILSTIPPTFSAAQA